MPGERDRGKVLKLGVVGTGALPGRRSLLPAGRGEERGEEEEEREAGALKHIRSVANSVSDELGRVIDSCENLADQYSGDSTHLLEISGTSQMVCQVLDASQDSVFPARGVAAPGPPPENTQDGAALTKARKLTSLTSKICDELESTIDNFGLATRLSLEASSLQEIAAVTRKVYEDMARLQAEPWLLGAGQQSARSRGLRCEELHSGRSRGAGDLAEGSRSWGMSSVQCSRRPSSLALLNLDAAQVPPDGEGDGDFPNPGSDLHVEGLPDLQEFLAQQDGHLTDADVRRLRAAFKRFKVPDSDDVHTCDLCGLLQYLGHKVTREDEVTALVKEITTYDYLDVEEFLALMEKFIPYEKEQMRLAFHKYDEDGSGQISVSEVSKLLTDLGFIPVHSTLIEGLAVVKHDGGVELNFQEFITFLAVYRRAEGFASNEVAELRKAFDHFSRSGGTPWRDLPADQLGGALVQVFGLHVSEVAKNLEVQVKGGKATSLTFPEFLVFARKAREAVLEKMRVDYQRYSNQDAEHICATNSHKHDVGGGGRMSQDELWKVLVDLGYTPLKQTLQEIFDEVDKDCTKELDFNEFFNFMLIFRQREGFSKAALEEFQRIFTRFDVDKSGEISALELADLFRELGYSATMDEIHVYVIQVDVNGSKQLDFREFVRLMRMHREQELRKISGVFYKEMQRVQGTKEERGRLSNATLRAALATLGEAAEGDLRVWGDLDFDGFVKLADLCRAERVAKEKKKAGFSDERIEQFQESFTRFDTDRNGEIDSKELMAILQEFGWQPKNRAEQLALMAKLEEACERARDAGVQKVGSPGSMTFWTFVQLCRMLQTEHEQDEEDRLNKLTVELGFSHKEVEEFRQIFIAKKQEGAKDRGIEGEADGMSPADVRRLIRALGVSVKGDRKAVLEAELEQISTSADGFLDFAGFLKLMRWLMESGWVGGPSEGRRSV